MPKQASPTSKPSMGTQVVAGAPPAALRAYRNGKVAKALRERHPDLDLGECYNAARGVGSPRAMAALSEMTTREGVRDWFLSQAEDEHEQTSDTETDEASSADAEPTDTREENEDMNAGLKTGKALAQTDREPGVIYKNKPRTTEPLNIGSYVRGALTQNWEGAQAERQIYDAGYATDGNGSGLVPEIVTNEVWHALVGRLPVTEAGARVVTLPNSSVKVPSEVASPSAAWVAELAEISDSGGEFDAAGVTPHKIAFVATLSNELLLDAPNVADMHIRTSLLNALSRGLATGFLSGTGADNQPTGLLTGSPSYAVDASSVELTHEALMEYYWDIVGAGGSPDNIRAIMAPGSAKHLDAKRTGSGADGDFLSFSSPVLIPRVVAGQMPVTSGTPDTTSVLIGDFSQAVTVYSFGGMRMDVDQSAGFTKDAVLIRLVMRVDIAVNQPTLIKRLDDVELG